MNKILVVDDDLDILTLVKIALTMNNFSVQAISRWEDISDTIRNFQPDLILLDVSLGGADGRNICKNLKHTEDTRHLPVVLFSANAEMGNYVEDCKANDFIAKPFELSHLMQTIRQHLN
jgi:DNA-binding response OmpR family regulator